MAIPVTCPNCGELYELADELAGRKARCQQCGTVTVVPTSQTTPNRPVLDRSANLSLESPQHPFTSGVGNHDFLERISSHIERHLGPVEMVWHEKIFDSLHIDLHWVKPTTEHPFHTLITSGMSELPMTPPLGKEDQQFAELCISLPPDWPMSEEALANEQHYWPLRSLKALARYPHEQHTWLGNGQLVPHGAPPVPYAAGTKLCWALIGSPANAPDEFFQLQMADRQVCFYGVYFLYREERDFAARYGSERLFERFAKLKVPTALDPQRLNACRPWWKWW